MSFFTSGTFWFLEGILAALIVTGFKTWMEDRGVPMTVWKWILFVLWVLWLGFTIAFITTSIGENETNAAVKGGIIFSLIAVIAGVGLWRLLQIGRVSVKPGSEVQVQAQEEEPAVNEQ
jgi:bacteriorhodopsin